jgi:hypothetical protein
MVDFNSLSTASWRYVARNTPCADAMARVLLLLCRNRKLNDWLGRIAITLYAYFDYDMLHKKHWEHHNFTGQPGKDPDFHKGNKNLLVWFGR